MSRTSRLLLLPAAFLALVLFGSGVAGFGERTDRGREAPLPSFAKLKRGMTPDQVRQILGAPRHIARQILYHRYREQWVYETSTLARLTFDCPRGQVPQLLSWPALPTEKTDTRGGAKEP